MTGVYLEAGRRRVFACAWEWPGSCRSGRDEQAALSALTAAAPRYTVVCAAAGAAFDPAAAVTCLDVIERVRGTATTDFGALDVPPGLDAEPVSGQDARRQAALVEAAWGLFDQVAAAPGELRKGPRGGGRDRAAIVEHVLQTEVLHARMLGLRKRPFPPGDWQAAMRIRGLILAALQAGGAADTGAVPPGGSGRRASSPAVPPGTPWTTPGRSRTGSHRNDRHISA